MAAAGGHWVKGTFQAASSGDGLDFLVDSNDKRWEETRPSWYKSPSEWAEKLGGERRVIEAVEFKDGETGIEAEIVSISTKNQINPNFYNPRWHNYAYTTNYDAPSRLEADPRFMLVNYTKGGKKVGEAMVAIYPGAKLAHISDVKIDSSLQGSGFGSRWATRLENGLKGMGVKEVTLNAGQTVGGYFWAKRGYSFDQKATEIKPSSFMAAVRTSVRKAYRSKYGSLPKSVSDRIKGMDAPALAGLKGPDGTNVGKSGMLGTDWYGHKRL